MTQILAIDQSTSATKAMLYDEHGALLVRVSRDHQQYYPKPGWVEHDAEEIWQNTLACLREVIQSDVARPANIVCLSITNQRETVVVFDRRTGKPLHRAIVWQCRRGEGICRDWLQDGAGEMVRQRTGLPIDPYFSASKISWLIREQPTIAARLESGEARLGTIDTYLIYRLTGGRVFATDHTNASRTMLFDIHKLMWDDQLCALAGVSAAALAQPQDSTGVYGTTDLGGAIDWALPIRGVMGDSQAALFAHRCFEGGEAKATLGTGTSVLLNTGNQAVDAGKGVVTAIAWTDKGRAVYCLEGIINCSAATLVWLRDKLGLIASLDECEPAARRVDGNGGVYLVPAFAGLGAPYWRPMARAAVVGMTSHSTRDHVIRAGVESIAYQVDDVLTMLRKGADMELKQLYADGGGTTNRLLMQFIADVTGTTLRAATLTDCSPLGAAMAGMLGSGIHESLPALSCLSRDETEYMPAMPRSEVQQLRDGWSRAVEQVLAGMDR